ncbi:MAG: site-specific integrase [Syntrophomonadaceae bacterium]|jgi:integrase|nr:site-specific integrase [Syntrophomonadaceae bacterium]NLN84469.1 site-specific integrase [Bacillota bacterium]
MEKKKQKRANGEGSIWQRANKTWVGQVSYEDPITGQSSRKSVSGKTKQEVLKKMRDLENAKDVGRLADNGKLTLGEWIDRWLEVYKKPNIKYSTWHSYQQLADLHIKPALGKKSLDRLRANEIQALYNKMAESGRIMEKKGKQTLKEDQPKGLSSQTIRNCHNVLRGALNQAYKEALIRWNPITAVELPPLKHREIQPLTGEQVQYFLKAIEDHELYPIIFTDLGTGLRRGELLGLEWPVVDLEARTARITQSLILVGGELYLQDDVKTKASKATITLPGAVVTVLRRVKRQQAKNKLLLGEAYMDNNLVFCREDGTPYRPDVVYRQYKKLLETHGLPDTTFHALRHTFCTLLLESGEDLATVSKLARHSTFSITSDLYIHKTETMQERAASKLDSILTGQQLPQQ